MISTPFCHSDRMWWTLRRLGVALLLLSSLAIDTHAQFTLNTEAQFTTSQGEHTPLWLNANRQGLSSLKTTNGYVRAGIFRPVGTDSTRRWKRGFGADVALCANFTSTAVVQQAYGEMGWLKGLLTVGAKEQTMELKNPELSTGPQTLGINARPVPGVRLSVPDYWEVPGTKGRLALKGHLFYGWTTDDGWQKDFTHCQSKYTKHTMLHTKAGYVRIGNPRFGDSHRSTTFTLELGLEMGCQFGGESFMLPDPPRPYVKSESGLRSIIHAFVPGGSDALETDYRNKEGNHVGSWLLRANIERKQWALSVYADHFFEDQSQMFFLDYDGYGTGEKWDSWEHFNWLVYDLRDIQLGVELRLKKCRWVDAIVTEYIYSKYQSGPVYHDHTHVMPDHVGGQDNYYNHYVFSGWQHWGQVMGNPLYRSPLYNDDGTICVLNNRFWAWHAALSGSPLTGLHYRLLATWQKGFGKYDQPFVNPQQTVSLMAEARYTFPQHSTLNGWAVKGAVAMDRGTLLGNNTGAQLTLARTFTLKSHR